MSTARSEPGRLRILSAFAAVYIIWGSTYLAIRLAIETLPPFLMASIRFVVAGGVLYLWARVRGARAPSLGQWRSATIVGGLLLLCGNGGVVWAEQYVPSGIAALLVATVSLWIVLVDWGFGDRRRPTPLLWLGLAVGLGGVGLLVAHDDFGYGDAGGLVAAGVVVVAALAWASGSIYSRTAALPESPRLATAMEMLAGGVLLGVVGAATGELRVFDLSALSLRSLLALAYLIVFGALIAYPAYVWLLRVQPAARVATYSYVNPAVALFLGWALADEPLAPRTALAATVIVFSVGLITRETGVRRAPVRVAVRLDSAGEAPGLAETRVGTGSPAAALPTTSADS
ncbi:MAG: EamA family transporter [Gemmatimonadota bacterium]